MNFVFWVVFIRGFFLEQLEWGSNLPRWLGALMGEKFFNACIIHEDSKKNEKNIFCLDCCEGKEVCLPRCYKAGRCREINGLFPCSILHHKQCKSGVYKQEATEQAMSRLRQHLHHLRQRLTRPIHLLFSLLQDIIFNCEHLTLPELGLDDGQMTPDSTLEPPGSFRTSSGSSGAGGIGCRTLGCTATTEVVVRKKRSNVSSFRPICPPVSEISAGLLSRRKGTPQRSPLY
ncbi:hypothetical protein Vadar_011923 [Vaccinium darrowii]|uniref:Uncharacterized protein n=1 Tax=Vaccinium darrowii TaxID=229202 RepID=A0ACB7ZAY1_9ERIC|nr:hypothetical protein Vadar_011923 [Vaccinium darrowii]